jgi:MFS family permease
MYSESDLSAAVAAGVVSEEAARALRSHTAAMRALPQADEEHFRLVTSFNDIFVSIAAVILLVAMVWIGEAIHPAAAGILVAASAWGLAEFFTRQRRMALPSILLLLAFVGGVIATPVGLLIQHGEAWFGENPSERLLAGLAALIALGGAAAAYAHWRRFMVPITVAAGTATLVATVIALIIAAVGPDNFDKMFTLSLVLIGGIGVFAFAMHWDRSDTARQTRRSDVAFWLHLLAAPMIAHPLFALLGVTDGDSISAGAAIGVVALYLLFGIVALAIDRRALLVSALAYVLYAMTQLFREFGAVELNVALTALVIGGSLLLLSAFWQGARRLILGQLPDGLRGMVPAPVYAGVSG